MDFGINIIEALKQRYGQGADGINEDDMFIVSGKNKKKAVEMVGADSIQEKQRYSQTLLNTKPYQYRHCWYHKKHVNFREMCGSGPGKLLVIMRCLCKARFLKAGLDCTKLVIRC